MIKSPTIIFVATLAAASLLTGAVAYSQTTVPPKSEPKFGPKDIPEPNGPALNFGPKDIPEPNGPALRFGPKDIPEPNGPALVPAQTAPGVTPPAAPAAPTLSLTDDQVKAWIDKAVYSSDAKKIGEIAAFARDGTGKVTEMHADIGGFLGMGETRVRLMPAQFTMGADRVVLNVTAEQAKSLPKVAK
jgi:hypothetical protein